MQKKEKPGDNDITAEEMVAYWTRMIHFKEENEPDYLDNLVSVTESTFNHFTRYILTSL